jgi:hypothetical protein
LRTAGFLLEDALFYSFGDSRWNAVGLTIIELCDSFPELAQAGRFVLILTPLLLARDYNAGWQMS